ncbi:MAG: asparagine synthase (glutamine-hydrolyzing) [Reichenbachiella sp.]
MCGITGIWAFDEVGQKELANLELSTQTLSHRGPNDHGTYKNHILGLGHRRLSIIDTSSAGHQPMSAYNNRYHLVFNGEIYNYQELRQQLQINGVSFDSDSDTEVLLNLLIHEGKQAIHKLNGFFAFAFYDNKTNDLIIARDRIGIKPLLYAQDESKFLFASELQAIMAYGFKPKINETALNYYLQLNYIPAPLTMVQGVKKLLPGELIEIKNGKVEVSSYYEIPKNRNTLNISYGDAQIQLRERLAESVRKRMVADVPLGCFLSGGIDSSVITAVASQQTDQLSTFSIGFSDNPFFDETKYAESVAKKFKTNHSTFRLTNDEIFSHIQDIVGHLDEPFADSSAIPVYVLSKKTKEHVTVALSGDGADEIFSGYNKHAAWWRMEHGGGFEKILKAAAPVAGIMPKSRSNKFSNSMRQIVRFSKAAKLNRAERYWFLASMASSDEVSRLLLAKPQEGQIKKEWMSALDSYTDMNDVLRMDSTFLLPNDMLKKVDLMSMSNSLEVRVPFLDHELLEFVFSLQESYKMDGAMRKKILQDTYRDILPKELYQRPKKGFEMPLLNWLKSSLKSELSDHVFNRDLIESQQIFNWEEINKLNQQLHSRNPEDSHARVWALYSFQKWYGRYF